MYAPNRNYLVNLSTCNAYRAVLVALLGMLGGCSTLFGTPRIVPQEGEPASFLGAGDFIPQDQGKALDVLLVHGMCTHHSDWAHSAVKNLYTALGGLGDITQCVHVADLGRRGG